MSDVGDELVGLYDEAGRAVGSAPRSRVRAQNLRHAATSIVVRDPFGRIYLHRRTPTKDVYPGLLDLAAGGVLRAGEDPAGGAVREVEEELGVRGVPLEPCGTVDYADDHTRYRAFRYTVTWDGPIRWQPEEVSWGEWVTVDDLVRRLEHEPGTIVPDSAQVWDGIVRAWHLDRAPLPGGWDSVTSLVEGRWVDRTPQRAETAPQLVCETVLLPAIAPRLPLEVPVPMVFARDPLTVRHRIVAGEPSEPAALTAGDGLVLGRFLAALHATEPSVAALAGVPSAGDDIVDRAQQLERFRADVLPLLPDLDARLGDRLLSVVAEVGQQALCHGDLVAEHVLVHDGRVTGVIDWGDARVTDPALDLAWPLHATNGAFATAVAAAYGATPDQVTRSRAWWALVPWFDVHRSVFLGDDALRDRDLLTLRERLVWWSD